MDAAKVLEKVLDAPRVAELRRVLDVYGRAPGGLLANGLAFTTLFAVVPIALVTLGVAGLLVDEPAVQQQLAQALGTIVPPVAELVEQALVSMAQGAAVTSIIGVLGLIWTVSQFYVTLDVAFARIFTDRPERDVLRRTARGFVWVAGLVGVVVALIVAGSLAAAAEALLPTTTTALTVLGRVVTSPPVVILVTVGVVLAIYVVVPPRSPSVRSAVVPAIAAGPLATAFIALAWLSFSFQILLVGAAWVRVRDDAVSAAEESALAGAAPPAEPGVRGE
jgi:uncharacterized BrkB/YihY/UPF0761 family membrane protein